MQNLKSKPLLNQVTDFDIKLLRLFKTVVECGSYTAAESILGITKSAISLQMSDLEKRLNMKVCHRGRGGVTLTQEGAAVLESAELLLVSIEQFRNSVNQINHELRGDLNIALVNNLVTQPQMRITNALRRLRQLSNKINIHITMSTPAEIEKGVVDGRFHLGAIPASHKGSGLTYQPLYDESYCLYCSAQHTLFTATDISAAQLAEADTIVTSHRMNPDAIAMHQRLHCSGTASDHEGIAFLILTGEYIGFLPRHYAEFWVQKGMMRALRPEEFHFCSEINLVRKKGVQDHQLINQFLTCIAADEEG